MKKITLFCLASLLSISAQAAVYEYGCTTDTGKTISVTYAFENDYSLKEVMIDNLNYLYNSTMKNMRGSGLLITVKSFRNGETLSLTILGPNSSYVLGNGSPKSMSCSSKNNNDTRRNDSI